VKGRWGEGEREGFFNRGVDGGGGDIVRGRV